MQELNLLMQAYCFLSVPLASVSKTELGFVPLRNIIHKRTVDESNTIIQLKLNGISYSKETAPSAKGIFTFS